MSILFRARGSRRATAHRSSGAAALGVALALGLVMACTPAVAPTPPSATTPPPAASPGDSPGVEPTPDAQPTATPEPPARKSLTIAQDIEPLTFDPHADTGTAGNNVFRHVFETLIRRGNDLELEGALAESWTNIDPTTWEFNLRSGVTFHNGEEMTASDVKFSFDRILNSDPPLRARSFLATIASVEVVDDTTVRVITANPDVLLPVRMTTYGYVLPEDYFTSVSPEAFEADPIGTGPFRFSSWVRDEGVTLEAYDDYWGGRPLLDEVVFLGTPEISTRVSALRTGEVDIVTKITPQDVAELEADPNFTVTPVESNRLYYIGMNTLGEPFDDVNVRRAVNHAVNVDAILENVYAGYGVRHLVAPPIYFGSSPSVTPYEYNPDLARQLLAEAGYADGMDVTFEGFPAGLNLELMQAIAADLAAVGIRTTIETQDLGSFFQKWLNREVEHLWLLTFGGPWLDIDAVMGAYFDSTRRAPYYNTPELDAMISEAIQSFDPAERERLYVEINQYIKDDAPWLFLFAPDDIYAANVRVTNWQPRSDEGFWLLTTDVTN